MSRYLSVFAFLAIFMPPALAQAPPAPLPIELSVEDQKQLDDYLGGQPFKVVSPIVNSLAGKQKAAQDAARKAVEDRLT